MDLWRGWSSALSSGELDPSELVFVSSTTTNATTGAWSFGNLGPLAAGTKYFVQEDSAAAATAGWTETLGKIGYVDAATSGINITTNNFANFKDCKISGTKY